MAPDAASWVPTLRGTVSVTGCSESSGGCSTHGWTSSHAHRAHSQEPTCACARACVYGMGGHAVGGVHTVAAWVSSECTLTPAGGEGV